MSRPASATERRRHLLAWAAALVLHGGVFGLGLWNRPADPTPPPEREYLPVDVIDSPEEPPPPPVPEPAPAPPPEPVAERPPPREVVDLTEAPPQPAGPPPTEVDPDAAADAEPVFGLSRQSFAAESGFAMRRGNTVGIDPGDSAATEPVGGLRPVAVHAVTQLPRILREPRPNYPAEMRAAGREGDVIVELVVDPDGRVVRESLRILETPHSAFSEAALEAVQNVEFAPARQGRTPVAVRIRLPVRFRLR